jgi:general secretion pathway protein D
VSAPVRTSTWGIAALLAAVAVTGCASRYRTQAEEHMRASAYEKALATYQEGLKRYPDDTALRAGAVRSRSESVARLLATASTLRSLNRPADAEALVDRALAIDPGSDRARALKLDIERDRRAQQALATARELLAKGQFERARSTVEAALKDNPRNAELIGLLRRVEAEAGRDAEREGARLAEARPISLQFRDANLKMVLDAISRGTGINFVLDRDIRSDARVTVLLRDARPEDAIDMLTSTNQLAKKVLDPNTVLIYPNTADKQKEYQDLVIRAFYLASADAKQTAALLRSMLKLREVFVDDKLNLIVIREPAETVRLAERLVALHDLGEPEVLLEVEVMEVKRTRLLELGIDFPDSFTLTPLSASGASGLTLEDLRNINSSRVGVSTPSVTINLRRETGDANVLANPRIRAKNRERARILIGDRVPVITTSATATGFLSESVQYVEVGLKLDVEPQVSVDDEIAIKVALEVSSLVREIRTISGSLAYQIGTRNASTTLRLRDGETQMLAGLISAEDRTSASRVPGLGDLPVLGRLFSSELDNSDRTEIVLSITPRLVRSPIRPDAGQAEFWSGTEASMRSKPQAPGRTSSSAARAAVASVGDAAPTAGTAGVQSAAVSGAAAAGIGADNLRLAMQAPATAAVGSTFAVTVSVNSFVTLRGMPVQLAFDRDKLQVEAVEEGGFFKQDSGTVSMSHQAPAGDGRLLVAQTRAGAGGVKGRDSLLKVTFKAIAPGDAAVSLTAATPIGAGDPVPAVELPQPISVRIQ